MSIGQAVAAGFRSANAGLQVVAVSFGFGLVMSLGKKILILAQPNSPEANLAALITAWIGMIVLALVLGALWMVWMGGALVWLKNRFDGAETSWAAFFEGGRSFFWALCWVFSLQMIFMLGPLYIWGLLGALRLAYGAIGAAALPLPLAAVGMLASLAIFILFAFGAYSLAERRQGAKVALKDSALFVRAHLGGTVGLLAALFLVSAAVVLVSAIPLILLAFLLKLPISPRQQQFPLLMEIPLQAVMAYVFFFALASGYAYYRGNQTPQP